MLGTNVGKRKEVNKTKELFRFQEETKMRPTKSVFRVCI
jgi:hypothetical protein